MSITTSSSSAMLGSTGSPAFTVSPCHLVTLSPCHLVTLSPCHPITRSPSDAADRKRDHVIHLHGLRDVEGLAVLGADEGAVAGGVHAHLVVQRTVAAGVHFPAPRLAVELRGV